MTNTLPDSAISVGPPPPFDTELAAALQVIGEVLPSGITPEMIIPMREAPPPIPPMTNDDLSAGGMFEVEERAVPGRPGDPDVSLLICRPTNAPGPVPVFYHMHGGGLVVGDSRFGVPEVHDWAKEFGAALVSVDYRLAPEHPYPAQIDDCYAGLVWTAEHAAELGIDPGRIILVGASAGGGLSAALALLSRDRGGPVPFAQMLLCPMLDDRNDTPSSQQMAGLGIWDRTANDTAWTAALGDQRGGPDVPAYAAPARATDLAGLPQAFIDVGSAETFRDETLAYATRLWQAGGAAELHVWSGGFHGFDFFAPQAGLSHEARAARTRWLHRVLGI